MNTDYYCEQVLSGRTPVQVVVETPTVLAYYHTRPAYAAHIVVIPKRHVDSLITLKDEDNDLLIDLFTVIRQVADGIVAQHGACRVVTNLGSYQDTKHLHFHVFAGKLKPLD